MKRVTAFAALLTLLTAVCSFAQGNMIGSVTIDSQSGPYCSSGVSFGLQVTRASGATGAFDANLSVTTTLPSGVTATFTPATLSFQQSTDLMLATVTMTGMPATTGSYSFTVKAERSGVSSDAQTATATLVIANSLSIDTNPFNQLVCEGQSATFTAAATGTPSPSVQWEVRSGPTGTWSAVPGATATTLSFTPTLGESGQQYRAVFTNACFSTATDATSLVVNQTLPVSVSIAANPGTFITSGTSVTFTATPVNGGGIPSYQWKRNGVNVGTDSPTYTTSSLAHGDAITCVLTSSIPCVSGNPATSNALAMQVNLQALTPAAGIAFCTGTTLNITWNGGDPSWNVYLSLVDAVANAAALTIATSTPNDGVESWTIPSSLAAGSYRVYIQKVADIQYYGYGGVFTINTPPAVTTHPSSLSVCEAAPVSFSVAGTGTPTPAVQWQVSTNGGTDWSDLAGETATNLVFASAALLQHGTVYRAVLTNTCGSAASNAATLSVTAAAPASVSISAAPSTTICASGSVTFTAVPTNGGSTPSYQWRLNGTDIGGATGSTYTTAALADGDVLRCVLTSNAPCATGSPALSNELTMTVQPNLPVSVSIAASPGTTVAPGTMVTFTATSANGGSSPSYQWKLNDSNVGTNSATWSSSTLQYGDQIVCALTSSTPCVTSNPAVSNPLTMIVPLAMTAPAAGASLCTGTPTTVTWAGGDPTWSVLLALVDFRTTPGAVVHTFTTSTANDGSETVTIPASMSAGGSYSVAIQKVNDTQNYDYGDLFTLRTPPSVTSDPQNVTICAGGTASFGSAATGSSTISTQWEVSTDAGQSWNSVSGATSGTLNFSASAGQDGHLFRAVFTNSCGSAASMPATLTVQVPPGITQQPVSAVVCPGQSLTITVGTSGTVTSFHWYHDNVSLGTTSAGALTIQNFSQADEGQYYVVVSGPCSPTVTSNTISLTMGAAPAFTTGPVSTTACTGAQAQFTISFSGTPNPTVQWEESSDNGQTWSAISGATGLTLGVNSDVTLQGRKYRAVLTNSCGTATSNAAMLTVQVPHSIIQQPSSVTTCPGQTMVTFTVGISGDRGLILWYKNGSFHSSGYSPTLVLQNVNSSHAGNYHAVVQGPCGPPVQSDVAVLTYGYATNIITEPQSLTRCSGTSATFSVTAAGTNLTYQWRKGSTTIPGATGSSYMIPSVASSDAGEYTVVVTGACGTDISNAATLVVNSPPTLTSHPQDVTMCNGQSAMFTVAYTGWPWPSVQWQSSSDGGVTWGNLIGATSSSLTLSNLQLSQSGYMVRAALSNSCGSVYSNAATLTVRPITLISSQPTTAAVCEGNDATFSVGATGYQLSYQWRVKAPSDLTYSDISNSAQYAGATSPTLTVVAPTAAMSAYKYRCYVMGCSSTLSSEAQLTIRTAPVVTTHPADVSNCPSTQALFTVAASGYSLTYHWQTHDGSGWVDLTNGSPYTGVTTTTLRVVSAPALNGKQYRCVVSGGCGSPAASSPATLTVYDPIHVSTPATTSMAVCVGSDASFSVNASGSGLSYQWQFRPTSSSAWTNVPNDPMYVGTNSATLTIVSPPASMNLYAYRCWLTGNCSPAYSAVGTLGVNTPPLITSHPANEVICQGAQAHFTVAASGSGLTYQWQEDAGNGWQNLSASSNYVGVTNATLGVSGYTTLSGRRYRCVVSGTCAPTATSDAATLTVNAIVQYNPAYPASSTVCEGSDAQFSVVTNGPVQSYQWQYRVSPVSQWYDVQNSTVYSGATTATLQLTTPPASMTGYVYRCTLTGPCNTIPTGSATLTVNAPPVISSQPTNTTVCEGSTASFSCVGTATGLSYQWQENSGSGWVPLYNSTNYSGTSSSTLWVNTVLMSFNGRQYRCIASGSCAPPAESDAAVLTVQLRPAITSLPIAGQTICAGDNAMFTVNAVGHAISYQWQVNGGSSWGNVADGGPYSGSTTSSLSITSAPASLHGSQYRCIVSGACTPAAISNSAMLTVLAVPIIAQQPQSVTQCQGSNVMLSVAVSSTQTVTYQWFKDGQPLSNATAPFISFNPLLAQDAGSYYVVCSNTCGSEQSSTAVLTVDPPPSITTQPLDQTVCNGASATFSVTTSGSASAYQWRLNGNPIPGAQSASHTIAAVTTADEGTYTVLVTGPCASGSIISDPAVLIVHTPPVLSPQNVSQSCDLNACGGTVALSANVSGTPAPALTYSIGGTPVTSPRLFPVGTTTVTVDALNSCGSDTETFTVTIVDTEAPRVIAQSRSVTLGSGGTATVSATWLDNGSTDNCAVTSVKISLNTTIPSWQDQLTFGCSDVGSNTVLFQASDAYGNSSITTVTITVSDGTAPQVLAQNLSVLLDATGSAAITPAQVNNGSSDDCGIALLDLDRTSFTCNDVGTNTVTLTVTDVNGNEASANAIVTVADLVAPAAVCRNVTVVLDPNGVASVTAADVDDGSTDACGIATRSVVPYQFGTTDVGANTVTLTVTDVNGNSTSCTSTVTVQKRQTALSYSGDAFVQYSDVATLTATLTDAAMPQQPLAGRIVIFTVNSQQIACTTDVSGVASATMKIWQGAWTGSVNVAFAGDALYQANAISPAFEIRKESAMLVYGGSPFFSFNSQGSASVIFQASVADADDGSGQEGNATRALVDFVNDQSFSTSLTHGRSVSVIFAGDTSDGIAASGSISVTQGNGGSYSGEVIQVTPTAAGCYYTGSGEMETVTVAVPGTDFVTGGGYLVLSGSSGAYAGTANTKSNFGFTMKRNNSGQNLQGQINILFRRLENGVLRTYRIKSNSINNLSTSSVSNNTTLGTGRMAVLSTKANLQDVTDPLSVISIGGNLDLNMEIFESTGTSTGADDQLKVTLYGAPSSVPSYTLLFASNWSNGASQWQLLGGGKIKVRNPNIPKDGRPADDGVPGTFALHQNHPNPFNPSTTIRYDLAEEVSVRISICTSVGQEIAVLEEGTRPAGRHALVWNGTDDAGADVGTGMYICRMVVTDRDKGTMTQKTTNMMLIR